MAESSLSSLSTVERELQNQAAQLGSLDEYLAWEQKCDECLESLEQHSRAKQPRLSVGSAHSMVARIAQLEGLKNTLRRRFVYAGAGHSTLVWREIDTAFNSRISTGAIVNTDYIDPLRFLQDVKNIVLEHVRSVMKRHGSIKVNTVFNGEFVAGNKRANKSINTRNVELFFTSDLDNWFAMRVIEPTLASMEEFQERDSGWTLSRILNLTVNVNKYNPLHSRCHIELPREIKMKRAIINVQSMDNACFAWAVVAALCPADKHADRQSSYPHYTSVLNMQDIEFPMRINQIKKFERLNDISVNIYSVEKRYDNATKKEGNVVAPIRLTEQKMEKHVNLLHIPDPRDDDNTGHFAWIKNLSRLVSSQLSKKEHKKHICDR
ncbi:uncharacterized protein LOC112590643 [Harpegnathos saltator]|uniref:uncharacterized protein LOC112590503 n=1 Tax=Harpegnathos saltator TaxID=610380 RepID=UPI000DBED929|nr:uncharacterized protein LOC112590503 [Harpegnathos saltator]XP_025163604.1 uncharacterized protein LOC112590643 [Harpegnathos saltator]